MILKGCSFYNKKMSGHNLSSGYNLFIIKSAVCSDASLDTLFMQDLRYATGSYW